MERFEYKGKWWLPQNPDTKVAGIIRFEPSEMPTLELLGSFEGSVFSELNNEQIILGVVEDGARQFTLIECLATRNDPPPLK